MRYNRRAVLTRQIDEANDRLLAAYEARDRIEADKQQATNNIRLYRSVREGLSYFGVPKRSAYKRRLSDRSQRRVLQRLLNELAIEVQRRRNDHLQREGYAALDDAYWFLDDELTRLSPQKDAHKPATNAIEIVPGMS